MTPSVLMPPPSIASASASSSYDARALVVTVGWLRACAAFGQFLAVVATVAWLNVRLPLAPLAASILLFAMAAPVTVWRLKQPQPVGESEATVHLAFDIALLGWALYFTGGASNPFITLLLVPVALSAAALSARATGVVFLLAGAVYTVLIFYNVPLPDMPMHGGNGFHLHLMGMAINFLIVALLLTVFIGRMRASINAQRETIRDLRERTLRDETILAIATQAAAAAHRLNTPLSTLRTLLPEIKLGREHDLNLCADVRVMLGEVERCRKILRGMIAYGQDQLTGVVRVTTLGEYLDASIDHFRLLHPEAQLIVDMALSLRDHPIEVLPSLAHALLSLMQNAFEASNQKGSREITLAATAYDGNVEFTIGDRGPGLPDTQRALLPMPSSKPNGLGIGLALARSTVERLHGEIGTDVDETGTRVRVQVPLTQSVHA